MFFGAGLAMDSWFGAILALSGFLGDSPCLSVGLTDLFFPFRSLTSRSVVFPARFRRLFGFGLLGDFYLIRFTQERGFFSLGLGALGMYFS